MKRWNMVNPVRRLSACVRAARRMLALGTVDCKLLLPLDKAGGRRVHGGYYALGGVPVQGDTFVVTHEG